MQYWWAQAPGARYKVEVVTARIAPTADPHLAAQHAKGRTVMVRVVEGDQSGMYAIVDPAELTPLGEC